MLSCLRSSNEHINQRYHQDTSIPPCTFLHSLHQPLDSACGTVPVCPQQQQRTAAAITTTAAAGAVTVEIAAVLLPQSFIAIPLLFATDSSAHQLCQGCRAPINLLIMLHQQSVALLLQKRVALTYNCQACAMFCTLLPCPCATTWHHIVLLRFAVGGPDHSYRCNACFDSSASEQARTAAAAAATHRNRNSCSSSNRYC